MTACPSPILDLPEFDLGLDLPSLTRPIAQVLDIDCNPFQRKELYKQETVRWLAKNGYIKEAEKIEHCGTSFIHLKCPAGHHKYVRMYCKNEFCPVCGVVGSREHKKRTTRARDRLMWAKILGYMVFTLPESISSSNIEKDVLNDLSKAANAIVTSNFNTPGGCDRWHFNGDSVGKLQIHLNVLFPIEGTNGIGKIDNLKLTKIKKDWTDFINEYFKLSLPSAVSHYGFASSARKKYHKIKYVLRPVTNDFQFYTLSDLDKKYILSLRRWHNTRWFGELSNRMYKKFLTQKGINPTAAVDGDPYLSRGCPVCGGKFRFEEIIYKGDVQMHGLRWLDNDILVDYEVYEALKKGKD